jgi:hypothetical protein
VLNDAEASAHSLKNDSVLDASMGEKQRREGAERRSEGH